jgi:sec-independent protein translocase protein TatA
MFRDISPTHIALILGAFIVLFGYKKLPDATRSIGRSMRIFKSEVKGLHEERTEVSAPVEQVDTPAVGVSTPAVGVSTPAVSVSNL